MIKELSFIKEHILYWVFISFYKVLTLVLTGGYY